MKAKERTLCLYHGGCNDGFAAAWAVWYGRNRPKIPDRFTLVPCYFNMRAHDVVNAHVPNPSEMKHIDVYIVDFAFDEAGMQYLCDCGFKSLTALDHHASSAEMFARLHTRYGARRTHSCKFIHDISMSGAMLAWAFAAKQPIDDAPWLIQYVQDRDLWQHKLPHSRECNAALYTMKHDMRVWDKLATMPIDDIVIEGQAILRALTQQVQRTLKHVQHVRIGAYVVPAVNTQMHVSEVGTDLLTLYPTAPFAACWFVNGSGDVIVSLRSDNSRVDVSKIAQEHGGGGHRNAAGFSLPLARIGEFLGIHAK